ncbi:ABC transporter substrate-binding protein [Alkalihalobacillus hemicellulosilyticus]|uniref:Probable sugar-binding periplasmic protein n=1 Tax=Halalkalibacter hemicellulosilyticusJCM 9152 TaxID=1236971 RepID=W4QCK2_9BACI|nr:ABC transporter substrate-binding protein [Halalkalibacter hemicellulosilyticus]GAE29682.1 beta-glucoside-regulated ABC transport system [Halalkalibacter hemicellulosilyticusJCM 9152]
MKIFRLLALMMALLLTVAACGSDDAGSDRAEDDVDDGGAIEQSEDDDTESNGAVSSSREKLEIFSWWTGAGEEDGLIALIELFQEQHPDIAVENAAVAGGAGTNAKAVLASRMQGNDPPATFQVHGGAELNESWVAADKMEPLNDLFEEQGWMDKFPQELIDMVSMGGDIYSVPVNIHRSNVLWYNIHVFEEHGLEPPTTFDEFFEVADALLDAGVTPLALGDREPWAATHLFETVLLGVLGPEQYEQLWTQELSFNDDQVVEAVEIFKRMLGYINSDHSSRNWQDASQLVANGEAAMNVMGDWAKGYFVNDLSLEVNGDFGYVATPGTEGMFMVVTDTFGLPKGVDNTDDVKKFLSVLGSVEGQDAFNVLKGSIPARVDADVSKYDEYGVDTINDFQEAELAASLAHGSAASEGYLTRVNQEMNIFVTQQEVQNFIDAIEAAAGDL